MGLTSALYSTLTGLDANQQRLDVIGNNISNVNTVGYKSSRLDFETLFSQTMSAGTPPGSSTGGTNPFQVGLGTKDGGITKNFTDGSQQLTGVNTEMAIQGNGFFVLQGQSGQSFTRDGTFKLNSGNTLIDANGNYVQGYGVDSNYNIDTSKLQNITVPLGELSVAQATSNVNLHGAFNGGGTVATQPTVLTLDNPIYQYDPTSTTTPLATAPTSANLMTSLADASNNPLFQVGDVVTVTGPKAAKSLTVTATTTLADYESFMTGALGINTTANINGTAAAPGVTDALFPVTVPPAAPNPTNAAQLTITGNLGTADDMTLDSSAVSIQRPGVTKPLKHFTFTKAQSANGESISTNETLFDSLGASVNLDVTAVLTAKSATGTTWSVLAESPDDTRGAQPGQQGLNTNISIGQGTLTFDDAGRLLSSTLAPVTISRAGTGAADMVVNLNFDSNTSALNTASTSILTPTDQDGYAKGTLNSFTIGTDGSIGGHFTNGQTKTIGQVALATFRNDQGLVNAGSNDYTTGSNSGLPVITAPGTSSAGTIVAGALELSNVDLSQEFVNLISASTGFSASSRLISTSNQLLQDLLSAAR